MNLLNKGPKNVKASWPLTAAPFMETTRKGQPWVNFGSGNDWPQRFLQAVDGTGPLSACIEITAQHVAGNGLRVWKTEGGKRVEHKDAMNLWYDWLSQTTEEDFLWATAKDAVSLNARTWHVRFDSLGKIAALDHVDNSRTRASVAMKDGESTSYFWSKDWSKHKRPGYEPQETPAFLFDETQRDGKFALYSKQYKAGKDSYSEPWFLGCLAAAEVWMRVDNFNRTQIDTGFMAGVMLFVRSSADKEKMAVLDEELEDTYVGALARGMAVIQLEPGEEAPTPHIIPRTDKAGVLDAVRDNSTGVICDTFMIPRILVTEQSTGLASQGMAIQESMSLFHARLVNPIQYRHIIKDLWRLFEFSGITDIDDITIEPVRVFDSKEDPVAARMNQQRIMLVAEARERVGLSIITIDGEDALPDRSNWDPRMNLMLIEVGPSTPKVPEDGGDQKKDGEDPEEKKQEEDNPEDPDAEPEDKP